MIVLLPVLAVEKNIYQVGFFNRKNMEMVLASSVIHSILVVCYIGGDEVAEKSRADYFKQRRESRKAFNVLLDKEKLEEFEKRLEENDKTKSEWLNEKIDEELKK